MKIVMQFINHVVITQVNYPIKSRNGANVYTIQHAYYIIIHYTKVRLGYKLYVKHWSILIIYGSCVD